MLPDLNGSELTKMPDFGLKKVSDLLYFDGPLLVELVSQDQGSFLAWWCDCDDQHHRWMYFRVDSAKLHHMKMRQIPMDQVIPNASNDGFVYFVDIDANVQETACHLVDLENIPDDYKPRKNVILPIRELSQTTLGNP